MIESGEATVEECVAMLYAELDKWNATYNPASGFSYDVVSAGRHRGLTVWPWTYNDAAAFAEAYLNGIYGLTTNFAWWASDFIVDIDASLTPPSPWAASCPPRPSPPRTASR